ncbi:MAG: hypothetical protein Q9227_004650 [Pyrenula ochraceoflavens]
MNIALDMELFTHLADNDMSPKTINALINATKAEGVLLAAFGAVRSTGVDKYTMNPSYSLFANAAFGHAVAECDPKKLAVQQAFNYQNTPLMQILSEKPASMQGFGTLMSTWGEQHQQLHHLYPVQEHLAVGFDTSSDNDPVFFVDIGGGLGQRSIALKQALPNLPGRFIVQDLPSMLEYAPNLDGIEFMAHDFFMPQPVKGARTYYLRQVLHDWPTPTCHTILKHLHSAMLPAYSHLLIHEQILPPPHDASKITSKWAATQDVCMMSLLGAAERTEAEWREMVEGAGLRVVKVYEAEDGVSEGVVECEVIE